MAPLNLLTPEIMSAPLMSTIGLARRTLGRSGGSRIGLRDRLEIRPWGERRLAVDRCTRRAGADEAVVVGEHDRRGPVADAELGEDAAYVGLHGRLRDVEVRGDLGIRCAARHQ